MLSVAPSPAFWVAVGRLRRGVRRAAGRARRPCTKFRGRSRSALVAVAFVAHGVDIGWRGTQHVHPAQSVREAIGFLAFILTGGYLLASARYRLTLGGVVVMPVALVLLVRGAADAGRRRRPRTCRRSAASTSRSRRSASACSRSRARCRRSTSSRSARSSRRSSTRSRSRTGARRSRRSIGWPPADLGRVPDLHGRARARRGLGVASSARASIARVPARRGHLGRVRGLLVVAAGVRLARAARGAADAGRASPRRSLVLAIYLDPQDGGVAA